MNLPEDNRIWPFFKFQIKDKILKKNENPEIIEIGVVYIDMLKVAINTHAIRIRENYLILKRIKKYSLMD